MNPTQNKFHLTTNQIIFQNNFVFDRDPQFAASQPYSVAYDFIRVFKYIFRFQYLNSRILFKLVSKHVFHLYLFFCDYKSRYYGFHQVIYEFLI